VSERRVLRQWEFWRAGFWQRPILDMLYAAALVVVTIAVAAHIPVPMQAAHALDAGITCHTGRSERCLRSVGGTLDGPHYSRGPGDRWWVHPVKHRDVLMFGTDPGASHTLFRHDGERVTALDYDGNVAAVRLANGIEVRTREAGLRGSLFYVMMTLMAMAMALMVFAFGWGSWRRTGSWVAVNGLGRGDSRLALVCFATACIVFIPVLFSVLPLFLGAPLWMIWGATGLGVALLAFSLRRNGLGRIRGR
jgi:hypothetical protein